jgi:D-alanyl-D-alanine carboxypeptidase
MTAILSIETIEKYNIKLSTLLIIIDMLVRVSDIASKMIGTTANLKSGTWIILKDLLYGAMLPSGNDAAYVLAEIIGFILLAAQKCENTEVFGTVEKMDLTE